MNELSARMAEIEQTVPTLVWRALQRQFAHLRQLEADIAEVERENRNWMKSQPSAQTVAAINGIGPLTATATVAVMGSPDTFRSGRAFAGSGGKIRLGGVTKRGDPYLRKLLIYGARIVVTRSKQRPPWVEALLSRRPVNVVIVALANKMARTAWALLAHGQPYDRQHVSVHPRYYLHSPIIGDLASQARHDSRPQSQS
jgi:transposase